MLAATRRFAKSWVAAVLIGLLVVSFAIFGINDVFKGNFSNDVITAGSRGVSAADFKREFDQFRKNAEQEMGQPVTVEMAVENRVDARVLEELASREAFGELLYKAGIRPSDGLMEKEIRKIQAFFNPISGAFDKALYQQRLNEAGLTPEKFDTIMRDEIAQSHAISAMVNGLRVPRAYTALGAVYSLEARDVGYFPIDPRSVEQPKLPTDAQLTAFMKQNEAQLTRPELRILTVVAFSPAMIQGVLPIDEAEVQKRFEFRKDTLAKAETRSLIQIPAKDAAAARTIAARLAKGEDAGAIAKSLGVEAITYVDKPRTAVADPRVGQAAFALKAGEVSGPIQGALGFAVIRVDKITPGQTVTLDQIRPQIEAELRKDAASEKVYALSQAYEDARAEGANLPDAAKKAGVPAMTVGPVTAQGTGAQGQPVPGLTPKILEAAFGLPAGGESDIQEIGNGEYFAVRVDRVIPKSMPPLAEIKPQLIRVWMMQELVKRMQAKADTFVARLNKGETLEAVATAAGSKVARVVGLDRQNAGQSQALSRDALMKAFGAKPGEVFVAQDPRFGLVVAKLEGVRAPPPANLARITEETRPQMTMGLFREVGETARRAAREEVKVKIYPDKARAALGLPPLEKDSKAGGAGKAEKSK
ncbi:peptidyl-prolyl cis-trans isomerase [Phenylobacterium sp. LH3H17]|uniref:peptidyl-prolyl cis-trans isomerase n=1 Tax=Phenylobacterium sp. LH3H17 TaxID=2903901 RepID=UPI0020C9E203|nr:peptidyl-prolyl cis-trans isomerase [Phenylobacterium sp. LH3H17]UTP37704.1 peptidyl-prolyl cis-trans isomerase [Phenylobacterium sp. LH3H17]